MSASAPAAEPAATPPSPARPDIATLLPAASRALAAQVGHDTTVTIVSSAERSYSNVWELSAGQKRFFLKWLPFRAGRELELAQLARQVFSSDPLVRTPGVACCPTPDTFLVEKLSGAPLHALTTSPPWTAGSKWLDARCAEAARVGSWIKRFHDATASRELVSPEGLLSYVQKREAAFPPSQREAMAALCQLLERLEPQPGVRVHGDFTPHNVLVDGQSIAVIDLAGISEFERSGRGFDVACMVVGLEETWRTRTTNHLRFFSSYAQALVTALGRESGVRAGDAWFVACYALRHFARITTAYKRTGRQPGSTDWHVRRLRLALDEPSKLTRWSSAP